ncbi:MAG: SPASM domain-containing protein [Planctomycetota bacterium]
MGARSRGQGDRAWKTADFSPPGEAYGRFLIQVFDDWFAHHRHRVSVRMFDAVLSILARGYSTECTFGHTCAGQVTLEHDGSVYGCDHFVEPSWRLGKVSPPVALTCKGRKLDEPERKSIASLDSDWMGRLDSSRFEMFAKRKQDHGAMCRACDFRQVCNGGCPKHRPVRGSRPAPSTLCSGYRMFFAHAMPRLEWLAGYIQRGDVPPAEVPSSIMPRNSRKPRVKTRKKRR